MAKYKVGDKVRVRSDLKCHKVYYMEDKETGDSFVEGMDELLGKVVTIKEINMFQKYRIEEMEYNWTDEMFEGLAEEPEFHVFDTVKHNKYGIGTVIETHKLSSGKEAYKIDFDEWNEDFPNFDETTIWFLSEDLKLIKAYSPN